MLSESTSLSVVYQSSRGASLTGDLVSSGLLLPAFFSSLQPERNANFLSSSRAAEFFLQTIKQVKEINGDEKAAQSFLDAGIDILSWVRPPPRQVKSAVIISVAYPSDLILWVSGSGGVFVSTCRKVQPAVRHTS